MRSGAGKPPHPSRLNRERNPVEIRLHEAKPLVALFGDDPETVIEVQDEGNCANPHSGPGLYAWDAEYPEDGSTFLSADPEPDAPDDNHPFYRF